MELGARGKGGEKGLGLGRDGVTPGLEKRKQKFEKRVGRPSGASSMEQNISSKVLTKDRKGRQRNWHLQSDKKGGGQGQAKTSPWYVKIRGAKGGGTVSYHCQQVGASGPGRQEKKKLPPRNGEEGRAGRGNWEHSTLGGGGVTLPQLRRISEKR